MELLCGALEDFILRILIFASLLNITLSEAVADKDDRPTAWIEGDINILKTKKKFLQNF